MGISRRSRSLRSHLQHFKLRPISSIQRTMTYFFDYEAPHWPCRLLDQRFGMTLESDDVRTAAATTPVLPRLRLWWTKDNGSTTEKDSFQISVDVQHFGPREVTVQTAHGYVVVKAKHEEKRDERGFISRQFVRRFKLPEGTNADSVESRMSSDGVLTIVAPLKFEWTERSVPIIQTGPMRKEDAIQETKSNAGN